MWEYPALARAVESHGAFSELTVHDVVWWRPVWPILTLVAEHTERVLVGPDVTHPYLVHPAVTAQNVAALDELSRGRAALGVGRGSFLEPLGVPRRDSVKRVRALAEEAGAFLDVRREATVACQHRSSWALSGSRWCGRRAAAGATR